jgi:hypothetical protein
MREWAARLLLTRTGQDVTVWNRRVAAAGLGDEQALRAWLDSQGVTGYGQALLVWEQFGYPDFLTAEGEELIASQYADRPQLRPVLDAVLAALPAVGPATVQARKTFVTATSAWPGATCPATARCGCSAAPSSGSWTSIPVWSRKRCAPSTGWSHESG